MVLQVIGTGSAGNCYLLEAGGSSLLLDAGIPMGYLWRKVGMKLTMASGCLITHEHGDHSMNAEKLWKLGIPLYASAGTINAISTDGSLTQFNRLRALEPVSIGEFTVLPFETQHDAAEPLGFLIRYNPTGETVVYATDTYYLKHTFPGVHYWIVECNYIENLIDDQTENGELSAALRRRLKKSHMSLRRLVDVFKANDLTKTRAIVLVHLSDERSDERAMVKVIKGVSGVEEVTAAATGMTIPLELNPF